MDPLHRLASVVKNYVNLNSNGIGKVENKNRVDRGVVPLHESAKGLLNQIHMYLLAIDLAITASRSK